MNSARVVEDQRDKLNTQTIDASFVSKRSIFKFYFEVHRFGTAVNKNQKLYFIIIIIIIIIISKQYLLTVILTVK